MKCSNFPNTQFHQNHSLPLAPVHLILIHTVIAHKAEFFAICKISVPIINSDNNKSTESVIEYRWFAHDQKAIATKDTKRKTWLCAPVL